MTLEQKPCAGPHRLPVRDSITEKFPGLWHPGPAAVVPSCVFPLSHLSVLSVPNNLGDPEQTYAACHFIFCQVIQSLLIRPVFGAGDPSSKLGPVRCATPEILEENRGGLDRVAVL